MNVKQRAKAMRSNGRGGGNSGGRTRRRPGGVPLDRDAVAYARLLCDPCGAPLVHGISGGTNGAIVARLEADAIVAAGASDTAGFAVWIPNLGLAFGAAATNDAVAITGAAINQIAAGSGFLATNSSSQRCVAGCLQMMYPGAENTRSGIVFFGVVPSTTIQAFLPASFGGAAGSTSVASLRVLCQFFQRTPLDVVETKFRPGQADGQMTGGLSGINAGVLNARGTNAILVTWSGLPVNTGIRLRTVAAYEYEPNAGNGLAASVQVPASANSTNDVLRYLDSVDPSWWTTAGNVAGYMLRGAADSFTGGASEAAIQAMKPTVALMQAVA